MDVSSVFSALLGGALIGLAAPCDGLALRQDELGQLLKGGAGMSFNAGTNGLGQRD